MGQSELKYAADLKYLSEKVIHNLTENERRYRMYDSKI